jgi:predicted N-acetyltransferase YhbS
VRLPEISWHPGIFIALLRPGNFYNIIDRYTLYEGKKMELTPYKKSEKSKIKQLFYNVFSEAEGESEGSIIANLVLDLINGTKDQDIFGFVAKEKEQLVGAVFFTRLSFKAPVEAFILSPAAVRTSCQRKGIGRKLINHGIEQLKRNGVKLVFTYGDPDFYSKVGFRWISEDIVKAPLALTQPEGWLCQSLVGDEIVPISEKMRCVDALNKPEYW